MSILQSQNQFSQSPVLGMLDQAFNFETLACQVDSTQVGSLVAGQAVTFSVTAGGVPLILASTAETDAIAGFVNYTIKDQQFVANQAVSISMAGNVMYLLASGSINRGQQVMSNGAAAAGTVLVATSGKPICGIALDSVGTGQLVRILLSTPCAPYAVA